MKVNPYCSRKGGCTIKGKFYHMPRVSEILAAQIKRTADKMAVRRLKKHQRGMHILKPV